MALLRRNDYLIFLIILLFALEVSSVTDYREPIFSRLTATLIFLFSGILISILPFLTESQVENISPAHIRSKKLIARTAFSIFFLAIASFVIYNSKINLSATPIDYHHADMIPQIKIRCQRLLHGQDVYAPINEIWEGQLVPYFPTMWLPYVPLEFFGGDVRWTGVIVILISLGAYFFLLPSSKNGLIFLIPVLLICSYLFYFLFSTDRNFIAWTEESVVIGYYLFLGFALIKKNPWLIATAIALCLLSRYVLVFWIPAFVLFAYFFESKKFAIKIFGGVTLLVSLLFLIPFGKNLGYFLHMQSFYLEQAINFKRRQADVLDLNIGFARFFSAESFPFLHMLLIGVALIIPFLSLSIFFSLKRKLTPRKQFFGLCSLKLTMTLFYVLIEIPFPYLFFVPVFFTLPIIFQMMRER